ncbi:GIY-YIG nuclease family protein [Patescibacteria group bacterium]
MFYTYILKSEKYNKFYTGYTDNLEKRLAKHNAGKSIYTRRYVPWEIVYYETFHHKLASIKREKYFKSAAGRKWLKKYVNK